MQMEVCFMFTELIIKCCLNFMWNFLFLQATQINEALSHLHHLTEQPMFFVNWRHRQRQIYVFLEHIYIRSPVFKAQVVMLWVDTLATTTHPVSPADEDTWYEHTLGYCSIASNSMDSLPWGFGRYNLSIHFWNQNFHKWWHLVNFPPKLLPASIFLCFPMSG